MASGNSAQPITLLSPKEVAKLIGVSETTVLTYLRTKKIKGFRLGGKLWRVNPQDVPQR